MVPGFYEECPLKVVRFLMTGYKAIAANGYHTVGLKEDGTIVAVGYNGYGQLGVSAWTSVKPIEQAGITRLKF
jgi:alpha-tubulin suppressor-like RCC1 family protein